MLKVLFCSFWSEIGKDNSMHFISLVVVYIITVLEIFILLWPVKGNNVGIDNSNGTE